MTVLSSATRTALLAQKAIYVALLATAYEGFEAGLATANKSYKLDTAEGLQTATKRSFAEQQKSIDWLESRIEFIDRRLNGGLVVDVVVRRKQGRGDRGYRTW